MEAHPLTGDREGEWSVFVTKNWRLTFRVAAGELAVYDVNPEDYQ